MQTPSRVLIVLLIVTTRCFQARHVRCALYHYHTPLITPALLWTKSSRKIPSGGVFRYRACHLIRYLVLGSERTFVRGTVFGGYRMLACKYVPCFEICTSNSLAIRRCMAAPLRAGRHKTTCVCGQFQPCRLAQINPTSDLTLPL